MSETLKDLAAVPPLTLTNVESGSLPEGFSAPVDGLALALGNPLARHVLLLPDGLVPRGAGGQPPRRWGEVREGAAVISLTRMPLGLRVLLEGLKSLDGLGGSDGRPTAVFREHFLYLTLGDGTLEEVAFDGHHLVPYPRAAALPSIEVVDQLLSRTLSPAELSRPRALLTARGIGVVVG